MKIFIEAQFNNFKLKMMKVIGIGIVQLFKHVIEGENVRLSVPRKSQSLIPYYHEL